MSNLNALKKLGAAITGGSADDIPGDQNAEVIDYIADNWKLTQAAAIPEAAGANVTQAEFKALLDALKTAGLMKSE